MIFQSIWRVICVLQFFILSCQSENESPFNALQNILKFNKLSVNIITEDSFDLFNDFNQLKEQPKTLLVMISRNILSESLFPLQHLTPPKENTDLLILDSSIDGSYEFLKKRGFAVISLPDVSVDSYYASSVNLGYMLASYWQYHNVVFMNQSIVLGNHTIDTMITYLSTYQYPVVFPLTNSKNTFIQDVQQQQHIISKKRHYIDNIHNFDVLHESIYQFQQTLYPGIGFISSEICQTVFLQEIDQITSISPLFGINIHIIHQFAIEMGLQLLLSDDHINAFPTFLSNVLNEFNIPIIQCIFSFDFHNHLNTSSFPLQRPSYSDDFNDLLPHENISFNEAKYEYILQNILPYHKLQDHHYSKYCIYPSYWSEICEILYGQLNNKQLRFQNLLPRIGILVSSSEYSFEMKLMFQNNGYDFFSEIYEKDWYNIDILMMFDVLFVTVPTIDYAKILSFYLNEQSYNISTLSTSSLYTKYLLPSVQIFAWGIIQNEFDFYRWSELSWFGNLDGYVFTYDLQDMFVSGHNPLSRSICVQHCPSQFVEERFLPIKQFSSISFVESLLQINKSHQQLLAFDHQQQSFDSSPVKKTPNLCFGIRAMKSQFEDLKLLVGSLILQHKRSVNRQLLDMRLIFLDTEYDISFHSELSKYVDDLNLLNQYPYGHLLINDQLYNDLSLFLQPFNSLEYSYDISQGKNAFYGYDSTDRLIDILTHIRNFSSSSLLSCDWILITNGDNIYNSAWLNSISEYLDLPHQGKDSKALIAWEFITHHNTLSIFSGSDSSSSHNYIPVDLGKIGFSDLGSVLIKLDLYSQYNLRFLRHSIYQEFIFATDFFTNFKLVSLLPIESIQYIYKVLLFHQ